MSKNYKHQATYDYLHGKPVKGSLLRGVKKYFNRIKFPRWDYSRLLWFKHKWRKQDEKSDKI